MKRRAAQRELLGAKSSFVMQESSDIALRNSARAHCASAVLRSSTEAASACGVAFCTQLGRSNAVARSRVAGVVPLRLMLAGNWEAILLWGRAPFGTRRGVLERGRGLGPNPAVERDAPQAARPSPSRYAA